VFLVLEASELDAVLHVVTHKSATEGTESPSSTCWPCFFLCSPGYDWLSELQEDFASSCIFFFQQYPQVFLHRAALNPLIPEPVSILVISSAQVQDLALGLVELHEVHTGLLLLKILHANYFFLMLFYHFFLSLGYLLSKHRVLQFSSACRF